MSARVKLSQTELSILIDNVERNGGDASVLRSMLKVKDNDPSGASDESHVKELMEQSTIEEGPGLKCSMCGNSTPLLIADCCNGCFTDWALSMRRKNNG
ncbi:hypothetical protein LCGC14_2574640 [marine sediment metagenome]|uniref:Uncharacterized protein n=1 Tax=marine sediment metagenome TaxID=412755 RepID=A0A0F9AG89_9ZZZZ